MNDKELVKAIAERARSEGERKVMVELVTCGMPPSTAEKLARGEYRVNRLLRKTSAAIRQVLGAGRESA